MPNNTSTSHSLSQLRARVDRYLETQLQAYHRSNPIASDLHRAMQYSLIDNGGNRWRPLLTYTLTHALGADLALADRPAAAVECIHAYSLIHDDLPAMDDDHYRRGQPSCHCAFSEATAILAGDSLNNMAFELLCQPDNISPSNAHRLKQSLDMTHCLARAAGARGMAYGQALDLAAGDNQPLGLPQIEQIHHYKTGCLFAASAQLAALAAGITDPDHLQRFYQLGLDIGISYQFKDDLEDAEQDALAVNVTSVLDIEDILLKIKQQHQHIQTQAQALFTSTDLWHRLTDAMWQPNTNIIGITPDA